MPSDELWSLTGVIAVYVSFCKRLFSTLVIKSDLWSVCFKIYTFKVVGVHCCRSSFPSQAVACNICTRVDIVVHFPPTYTWDPEFQVLHHLAQSTLSSVECCSYCRTRQNWEDMKNLEKKKRIDTTSVVVVATVISIVSHWCRVRGHIWDVSITVGCSLLNSQTVYRLRRIKSIHEYSRWMKLWRC